MEVFYRTVSSCLKILCRLVLAVPAWSLTPKPELALDATAGVEHLLGARHGARRMGRWDPVWRSLQSWVAAAGLLSKRDTQWGGMR